MFDDCGIVKDGAIVGKVTSGAAVSLWFAEIAGMAVCSEDHVAAMIC